jgi:hypothetical protein
MKLTIEMSPENAVILLQGLDVTEVVINSLREDITSSKPKSKMKRKVKQLEKEVAVVAKDAVKDLSDQIENTYSDIDTTGEKLAALGSPWAT